VGEYETRALTPATWDAFAALCERHNGVWNGCWCTWFHPPCAERGTSSDANRAIKRRYVEDGVAHAALVFDGDEAIGWCEYGTPAELPQIHHRKQVEASGDPLPDWRVTCYFVDRRYRRSGVAEVALTAALRLIAEAGGGLVEAYPQDTGGQRITASFLYAATRSMVERAGFEYVRPKGKNHCVMRKVVAPADVGAAARQEPLPG
jgi:GNAT superfamily N-acetyltransferase